jgi:hypothetical protein
MATTVHRSRVGLNSVLAHALRSTQDVLNPYVTILLMLLQTILQHPEGLSALERAIPWSDLATFLTARLAGGLAACIADPQLHLFAQVGCRVTASPTPPASHHHHRHRCHPPIDRYGTPARVLRPTPHSSTTSPCSLPRSSYAATFRAAKP